MALASLIALGFAYMSKTIPLRLRISTSRSSIVSAVFMVVGGQLSDKLGRRRTLAVYLRNLERELTDEAELEDFEHLFEERLAALVEAN